MVRKQKKHDGGGGVKRRFIHNTTGGSKNKLTRRFRRSIRRNVIINQAAPIVWEDKSVDKKVDALLEAIHKEGGLGLVTWVDHGTNIIQTAKNIEKNDGEKAEYANEKSDGKETSLKHKTEVIRMKMELVQQAKKDRPFGAGGNATDREVKD
ncbi:hypothetical protein Bca4012_044218 [Brassica carinata]|uniref:Uncharacterized protein n=1 Tax=Brassica carinata TaxID=52824 RepID=A0A8X7QSX4_BRACI|nr:hypothetical protein Bca52824_058262 [Brassica carinata]